MDRRMLGLPMKCTKCPPKSYFGTLKAAQLPTSKVKPGKNDRCPNCGSKLIPTLFTDDDLTVTLPETVTPSQLG